MSRGAPYAVTSAPCMPGMPAGPLVMQPVMKPLPACHPSHSHRSLLSNGEATCD